MVPGEQGADRVATDLGDLFEAQLPVVSQFDDLAVPVAESAHRSAELIALCGRLVALGHVVLRWYTDAAQVLGSSGGGVPAAFSAQVPDPVHSDPKKPWLESSLLAVDWARGVGILLREFGSDGHEDRLGDLLGEVVVMEAAAGHGVDAS